MSSILRKNELEQLAELPVVKNLSVGIVVADWNHDITWSLAESAVTTLKQYGCADADIKLSHVPGTVELTYAARTMAMQGVDAVIIIGCVIRGDTPHFDYVCQSVTQGCTLLNAEGDTPIIFCVLTVENEQQALDRAGGVVGDKGIEAAMAAVTMAANRRSRP